MPWKLGGDEKDKRSIPTRLFGGRLTIRMVGLGLGMSEDIGR
jgi:hypothetical protein